MYKHTQLPSVPQSWSNVVSVFIIRHWRALGERLKKTSHGIWHTVICFIRDTAQLFWLGLFQESDFAGDLQDSNSISGEFLCIFGSHTFVSISWMCKKQPSVSHSSKEAEIISLDAGLRMDGLLALDLWDITSRIWIESTECRRSSSGKYSQESQRWASSRRFKVWWETDSVNLSTWKTGSSSCQRTTTLNGKQKEIQKDVIHFTDSCGICSWIHARSLVFLAAWIRKEIVRDLHQQTRWILGPNGKEHDDDEFLWIQPSNVWCLQCFRDERITKQGRREKSTYFNGSHENIGFASLQGDFCESAQYLRSSSRIVKTIIQRFRGCREICSTWSFVNDGDSNRPLYCRNSETSTNAQQRWNLVQEYERKFEHLSEDQKLSKLFSLAGLKLVETGQYFYTHDTEEGQQMQHLCREFTIPQNEKGTRIRGWFTRIRENRPSLEHKNLLS